MDMTTLGKQMADKSDDELRQILQDADQYRDEAIAAAREEAARRRLSPAVPEPPLPPPADAERALGVICSAGGRTVVCPHCAGNRFFERRVLLTQRLLTFLDLEWLNKEAAALTCVTCGRIEWFLHVETQDEDSSEDR